MGKMRLENSAFESSHRNAVPYAIHVKQLLTLIVFNPKVREAAVIKKKKKKPLPNGHSSIQLNTYCTVRNSMF